MLWSVCVHERAFPKTDYLCPTEQVSVCTGAWGDVIIKCALGHLKTDLKQTVKVNSKSRAVFFRSNKFIVLTRFPLNFDPSSVIHHVSLEESHCSGM